MKELHARHRASGAASSATRRVPGGRTLLERLGRVRAQATRLSSLAVGLCAALAVIGLSTFRKRRRRLPMDAAKEPRASEEDGAGARRSEPAARPAAREPAGPAAPASPFSPTSEVEPSAAIKLDLGPAARDEAPTQHIPQNIPWSYGLDRITAAAVDPERLYAYWEVTDRAIEQARAGLGPGGTDAWLCLRVYDTTGLLFDGTNAHGYFDHALDRSDRQWFFTIGKPSSTAFVELGMKSREGFFVRIARSGRVDFPRAEPAPWSDPEWMTVVASTGEARREGVGAPARGKPLAPLGHFGGEPPAPFTPIPLWVLHELFEHEGRTRELLESGGGLERMEWREVVDDGGWELFGRTEWQGPRIVTTWEAGPFTYPVEVGPLLRQGWQGQSFAYKVGDVTHVVHGPWQVVIRNLGARGSHEVLGRWEIYRSWAAGSGGELASARPGEGRRVRAGASEEMAPGASERRWISASELRLGGASERWRLGASELRLRGASELLFAGASQLLLAGASELRLRGASELLRAGASEQWLAGASERRLAGASERRLAGGSEGRFAGASERVGASERRPAGDGAYPPPPGEGDDPRTAG